MRTGSTIPSCVAAAVVAVAVAACGGSSSPSTSSTSTSSSTSSSVAAEHGGKLAFAADPGGALAYTVRSATATAGKVTITMTNESGVPHNLAVQQGTDGIVLGATSVASSGTMSMTLTLKAGTYTFFCQVPGHRQAGMVGTLTVS